MKYFELIKEKNKFLNYLIEKYAEDPKEGKKKFILTYLKTCSLFLNKSYMVTTEIEGKHYYNVSTYLDEDTYYSDYFEEMNVTDVVKLVEEENNYAEYQIDYIQIDTPSKKAFVFTTKEYRQHDCYIDGGFVKTSSWLEKEDNADIYYSAGSLSQKDLKNSKRYEIDSNYQLPEIREDYVDLEIKPKELVVFGGRPYMGKTLLAVNIALKEIDKGGKVLFICLNNTARNVAYKLLAVRAEISLHHTYINKFTKQEYDRAIEALPKLKNIGIVECEYYNIEELKRTINNCDFKPSLIIIDDFQAIHLKDAYPKSYEENENIAKQLKSLASHLNTKIVVTSKISRNVESRINKRPKIDDIKGGRKLGEIADKVYMIYREMYYADDDDDRDMTVEEMEITDIISKARISCCFERRLGTIERIPDEELKINKKTLHKKKID